MLDRKFILENIGLVENNCRDRGVAVDVQKLVTLEQQRRKFQTEAEEANRQAAGEALTQRDAFDNDSDEVMAQDDAFQNEEDGPLAEEGDDDAASDAAEGEVPADETAEEEATS